MTWPTTKMGEYFRVKHGYAFKGEYFDSEGPHILLTPGSFYEEGGYRDQGEKTKFYTGDVPDGYILDEGDLLVAMTEQTPGLLGSSAWIPESGRLLHNQRLGRIVDLDERHLNKQFLYYLFNTKEVRDQISATATGGKVRHTAPERIAQVMFRVPPLDTQQSIAAALSAYDDLIENNRRRMALLEESARQLYREWFVRLRFPGHEHTRITDGVPEGWERIYLGGTVNTQYGFTETATDEPVGPKFLRGTDINKTPFIDWSTVPYCPIDEILQRKYQLRVGDIVIIRMADPGKVAIVERDIDAVFASYLIRLLPSDPRLTPYYLFYVLSDDAYQGFISGVSTGSTRKTASAPLLVDFHLLLPPQTLLRTFEDSVRPLRQQITTLLIQNEKLRAARDLLLPKLMSGEIAV